MGMAETASRPCDSEFYCNFNGCAAMPTTDRQGDALPATQIPLLALPMASRHTHQDRVLALGPGSLTRGCWMTCSSNFISTEC